MSGGPLAESAEVAAVGDPKRPYTLAIDVGGARFPVVKLRDEVAIVGLSSAVPRPPFVAAGEIGRFLSTFLRSPDGSFYTSQDADLVPGELHAPAACGNCAARCVRAARMKPVNSGWPSRGVEVNSG